MNFSDLFKHTGQQCSFSPDRNYLANAVQYRLIIRDVKTLQISQLCTCLDAIQYIEWSPDSQFVLCGMYKRALIQVWSLEQPEWNCKIDEGSAGLIDVHWSPDSRHILSTADFHLRITVWSLVNKSVSYIKHPKPCVKGYDFTRDGKYLALAERRDCKDYISIFDSVSWQLVKHFDTATEDLAGVEWSPDGTVICVWESCLQYKVLLYSLDGQCQESYSAYDFALGIKSIAWSSSSQFLAIGSYDEKLRLLNHVTWKLVTELEHPSNLENISCVVYRETMKKPQASNGVKENGSSTHRSASSHYEVVKDGVQIPIIKPDINKACPRVGVGMTLFSPDSRYLCTKNDNMPTALWIWDIPKLKLVAVLIQESGIKKVAWDPHQSRLALCTGNNKFYMWSPAGSLSLEVPCEGGFNVQDLKWNSDGASLLLIDKEQMCVCYIVDND